MAEPYFDTRNHFSGCIPMDCSGANTEEDNCLNNQFIEIHSKYIKIRIKI